LSGIVFINSCAHLEKFGVPSSGGPDASQDNMKERGPFAVPAVGHCDMADIEEAESRE